MDIKMVDLATQYQRLKPEIDRAIAEVLESTAFINGPAVAEFDKRLGKYLNTNVISCANGTDALQIAMMALELRAGDEVILPVHTYVATAEVIALLGLVPVFAEVHGDTFNLDVSTIESKITSKTKAIVPVHLYGQCADMEPLLALATKHNLFVIEDTAQALGARFTFADGTSKFAGTMGVIGTTSFFPSKNLGCFGDGGALMTNDTQLATKIRMIANHGQRIKYHHDTIGVNSRLDTLQAAILNAKLDQLDDFTARRNKAAAFYDKRLGKWSAITIPARSPFSTHVFHQYTIKLEKRDVLKKYLEQAGIPTMIYYPVPLHLQQAYKRPGFDRGSFPLTERLSQTVLSLPIHTELTDEQLDYICSTIESFLK